MKKSTLIMWFVALVVACPQLANAQLSGGGDLNPDLKAPVEAQNRWQDLRVGLSVHWGPSSLGGEEIGWSRESIIPREVYDDFYKDFNPVRFDANEWCELMKRWGIRFVAPTAKHHDGFALWYSDYSEYDMENAKRKIDIMAELKKACDKHDIMLGAYYSNIDWFHPDWAPYQYGGPGDMFPKHADSPNLDRYFKYMENQVKELIAKYDVDFIQFDGEWDSTYTHEVGSRLYRVFHEAKPDILLNSRIDIGRRAGGAGNHLYMDGAKYAGDFQDRERVVNYGNEVIEWCDHPWQAWVTIDKNQWSHNPNPNLMTADELVLDMLSVVGSNGNYMINVAPKPDGSFDATQIALMDTLGMWLKEHEETIYATRGGPFYPFEEGVSTRKGKKAWIFVLDEEATKLNLTQPNQEIRSAKIFGTKTKVSYDIIDSTLVIQLPKFEGEIRVVELTFDQAVEMCDNRVVLNTFEQNGAVRISEGVSYTVSSESEWSPSEDVKMQLFEGVGDPRIGYAFHTKEELNPHIIIDLNKTQTLFGLPVHNRKGNDGKRAEDLAVWISDDGVNWTLEWEAAKVRDSWDVPFTQSRMGAEVYGVETRYIKVGLNSTTPNYMHLPRIEIYVK